MQEGRLFTRDTRAQVPTLDELKERYRELPRRGVAELYLLRTRGRVSRYELGIWAWALHRLTGLGLVAYTAAHVLLLLSVADVTELEAATLAHTPYYQIAIVLAVAAITYHGLNGLRLLLGDWGILPTLRYHKIAIWIIAALSLAAGAATVAHVVG